MLGFIELGSNRQIGFSLGPIPSLAIYAYTQGWPPGEASLFKRVIMAMDRVYLAFDPKAPPPEPEKEEDPPAPPPSDNQARDAFRAAMRRKPPEQG